MTTTVSISIPAEIAQGMSDKAASNGRKVSMEYRLAAQSHLREANAKKPRAKPVQQMRKGSRV